MNIIVITADFYSKIVILETKDKRNIYMQAEKIRGRGDRPTKKLLNNRNVKKLNFHLLRRSIS